MKLDYQILQLFPVNMPSKTAGNKIKRKKKQAVTVRLITTGRFNDYTGSGKQKRLLNS